MFAIVLSNNTAVEAIRGDGTGTALVGVQIFEFLEGPAISNVNATDITESIARITWDTNAASNSTVNYGTTISLGTIQTNSSSQRLKI